MKSIIFNKWQLFLLIFIALLPLMILRDFTPDNELKYLSIADEAIENTNVFAFYNHGIPYADKPPLYLWLVMIGKLLFGKHLMFFLSLFSIIPALITAAVMDRWVRKELPKEAGDSAILLLFSSAFYLACSIVLRMDMLMTMFITLAIYTFYRMYQSEDGGGGKIALPVYIFLAIFTKGAVGFLVPVVSIAIFLFINGKLSDIWKYLGWRTWAVLGGLCAIWFAGVYLDGGTDYLNNLLFNQTINRAVDSFHHKEPTWYYGVTYWYAIAPWSLLVFTVIVLGYIKGIAKGNLEKLFATVTFSFLIMMSLISSKLVVYLLPCFPFMIYLAALLLQKVKDNFWVKLSVALPAVVFIVPLPALLFLLCFGEKLSLVSFTDVSSLILFPATAYGSFVKILLCLLPVILAAGGITALVYVKRNIYSSVKIMSGALFLFIFAASPALPLLNNMIGLDGGCKKAIELSQKMTGKGEAPVFSFYDFNAGPNLDAYFKKYMKQSGQYTAKEIAAFKMRKLQKEELSTLSNVIMFVKTRDFGKDSVLNAATGELPRYNFGEFSIVPIN